MKKHFSLALEGRDWSKPYITFWILYIIFSIPTNWTRLRSPSFGLSSGAWGFLALVSTFAVVILTAAYFIKLARIAVSKLSIDGKTFGFQGAEGKFIGMNVGGFVLSLITIFIYTPWYMEKVAKYLGSETTFDGEKPEFLGSGRRFLPQFIPFLWIPLILLGILAVLNSLPHFYGEGAELYQEEAGWIGLVTLFLFIPLIYIVHKWFINFRWKDISVKWETDFWPSVGTILGQFALTLITVGIYGPAAFLRLYRYFAAKTVLLRGDQVVGRMGFDGSIKTGFGLLWGQLLLSIITIGFYLPWAYAKVARWILESSYYVGSSGGE